MNLIVRIPWEYSLRTCDGLFEEIAYKIILRNICIHHRYFDKTWLKQSNKHTSKWFELMTELVNKGIYTTNRREYITMALHCMYHSMQMENADPQARNEFIDIAKNALIQLESKISNRYLHDIKIYQYKKPVRNANMTSERVYLVQYQMHNLMQTISAQDQLNTLDIDYNFSTQRKWYFLT